VCGRRAIDREACARQRFQRGAQRQIPNLHLRRPLPARSKFSPPQASSHTELFGGILCPLFRAGHNAGAEIVRDRYDFAHVCP
jgi:hypothetical protein